MISAAVSIISFGLLASDLLFFELGFFEVEASVADLRPLQLMGALFLQRSEVPLWTVFYHPTLRYAVLLTMQGADDSQVH